MQPIQVGNYDFKRIYLWLQYSDKSSGFTEIVMEVFYPNNMQAEGLVMFNHGFLVGTDVFFYPKLLISKILNQETPLFQIHPAWYYNYSQAAIENNWALAFISSSHQQFDFVPRTNVGGDPRTGQAAYAAASYLVRYGATYKYQDEDAVEKAKFLKAFPLEGGNSMTNRVLFAGHSIGGAHAQVAATGFQNLQEIGARECMPFDPVFYNREIMPRHTPPMSVWDSSMRANPVGLLQLSPVDGAYGFLIPWLVPGMKLYREALSNISMPNLMVTGNCDMTCLSPRYSAPPAWIEEADRTKSQYAQMAYSGSNAWAATCMVENGSHCGYLRYFNKECSFADKSNKCDGELYPPAVDEYFFTNELFNRYIKFIHETEPRGCTFEQWKSSSLMQWLDNPKLEIPFSERDGTRTAVINLHRFSDGYVHFPC